MSESLHEQLSQLLTENIAQLKHNYKRVHSYTVSLPRNEALQFSDGFSRARRHVAEAERSASGYRSVLRASQNFFTVSSDEQDLLNSL